MISQVPKSGADASESSGARRSLGEDDEGPDYPTKPLVAGELNSEVGRSTEP
jgi:hypothetical protein